MVENQNIKAIEVLSNAMQSMVDKKVDGIARDRTRIGIIKNINSNGTYNVLIDGREYDNIQAYGDGDIVLNEIVKIIYPDNNPTNMFILVKPSRRLVTTTANGWMSYVDKIIVNNLNSVVTRISTSVAVGTAHKGDFSGHVLLNNIVEIIFENGNTVTSPSITIGSTVYVLSGTPNIAPVVAGTNQVYRFLKTADTVLTFSTYPDYICERNTSGIWKYERYASGKCESLTPSLQYTGTLTMAQIATSVSYVSQDLTLNFPSGLFNDANFIANLSVSSRSYVVAANPIYDGSDSTKLTYVIIKTGSSTATVALKAHIVGTWK